MAPELPYRLVPPLAELGATAELAGVFPLRELDKGALNFAFADGISYELDLVNTGNGVVLSGTARALVTTECSRCLEPASFAVTGEVEGYFILNPRHEERELADDEFVIVGTDGTADLAPALIAAIVFELPQVVLCQPDCAGLCPVCGANRNTAGCSCADDAPKDGPFAVLKDLLG